MSSTIIEEKCIECKLDFIKKKNCIACNDCNSWFHSSCAKLSDQEFFSFCNDNTLRWVCSVCKQNSHCHKCNIRFKSNDNSICCDLCQKFYHLRCSRLTKKYFFGLSYSDESWFCRPCNELIFPFSSLDNNKLHKFLEIKPKKSISQTNNLQLILLTSYLLIWQKQHRWAEEDK